MLTRTRQKAEKKSSKAVQRAQVSREFLLESLYGGASPSRLFRFRWGEIAQMMSHDIDYLRHAAAEHAGLAPGESKHLALLAEDAQSWLDRAGQLAEIVMIPTLERLDDELGCAEEEMVEIARQKESRSQTAPASPVKATQ